MIEETCSRERNETSEDTLSLTIFQDEANRLLGRRRKARHGNLLGLKDQMGERPTR
jgi:hypothetical protein